MASGISGSAGSTLTLTRRACVVLWMMMMVMAQEALSAPESKYCKPCGRTLQCPTSCPNFNNGNAKSLCHIDCQTCTTQCKVVSNGTSSTPHGCNKKGAICKDPRFIGGDGSLFYFHGKANEDFCIVTDPSFHINGHFIGKHVEGRPRDFTWVQAIGIMYGSHKISIGAKKVGVWDDNLDQMEIFYDDKTVTLDTYVGESWTSPQGDFKVTRSKKLNSVNIQVSNLLKVSANVTYVDKEDSRIHNYGIDSEDCFAHLDLQFTFLTLSSQVDGVLGQTYKQTYKSLVKRGVPMPTMGGYEKFKTSSLFATDCLVGVFDPLSVLETHIGGGDDILQMPSMSCTSRGENGIVCRR